MAVDIPIWPGSSSFVAGTTPFGFYDTDLDFTIDIDRVSSWCATRLGYPIVDIELQDINFYACFEESITEYSSQINQYQLRDNLLSLQGSPTSSNYSQAYVNSNFGGLVSIARDYGSEAGSGGRVNYYTGSFQIERGKQLYDLTDTSSVKLEVGVAGLNVIEIKELLHYAPPAVARFFDPMAGSGMGSQQMLQGFGWGNYSPGASFLMQPMYADLLRMQAIEFNDQIRKSQYSFDIKNDRVRIFPIPNYDGDDLKIHFHYILKSERSNPVISKSVVSDSSNARYDNIPYSQINDVGRRWIQKYTLAIVKEMLGAVRSKFSSIPIPNSEITMDGDALRSEGAAEREQLIETLRVDLDATSRKALLENKKDEAEFLNDTLSRIPNFIYIA